MEKKVLKKIDNIRNNLLHLTDELKDSDIISDPDKVNLVSEKIDILTAISTFRSHLVKALNKTINKKD